MLFFYFIYFDYLFLLLFLEVITFHAENYIYYQIFHIQYVYIFESLTLDQLVKLGSLNCLNVFACFVCFRVH